MNEKIAECIRRNDYSGYIATRYPAIADYEELIFTNQDFSRVDWRIFPSSMNTFIACNLNDLILPPGQPIKIEQSSAIGLDIRNITAIIHAKDSDFTDLKFDDETILANKNDLSDIPSTFENCIFNENTKKHFEIQGVVFKN